MMLYFLSRRYPYDAYYNAVSIPITEEKEKILQFTKEELVIIHEQVQKYLDVAEYGKKDYRQGSYSRFFERIYLIQSKIDRLVSAEGTELTTTTIDSKLTEVDMHYLLVLMSREFRWRVMHELGLAAYGDSYAEQMLEIIWKLRERIEKYWL